MAAWKDGKLIRLEVYYDSWCQVCTKTKNYLERLDKRKEIEFRSIRDENIDKWLQVPMDDLVKRMHVLDLNNMKVVSGISAIRLLTAVIPSLKPLFPIVWIAEKIGLGGPLYDWLASKRSIVPVGHCENGACSISKPKE